MRTFQVKAWRFLVLIGGVALAFVIGFRHGCVVRVKGKLAASVVIGSRTPIRIHGAEHRRWAARDCLIFAIPN
jgi:hypothetical protein